MWRKLVRPYHDAFEPLLREAMRKELIAEQPLEMLYFMLLHAVTMSVSFRHFLEYFGEPYEDIERLKRDMTTVRTRNLSWKAIKQYLEKTKVAKMIELCRKSGFTLNIAARSLAEGEPSAENRFLFVANTEVILRPIPIPYRRKRGFRKL